MYINMNTWKYIISHGAKGHGAKYSLCLVWQRTICNWEVSWVTKLLGTSMGTTCTAIMGVVDKTVLSVPAPFQGQEKDALGISYGKGKHSTNSDLFYLKNETCWNLASHGGYRGERLEYWVDPIVGNCLYNTLWYSSPFVTLTLASLSALTVRLYHFEHQVVTKVMAKSQKRIVGFQPLQAIRLEISYHNCHAMMKHSRCVWYW